jgi:hypothetical protein
MKLIRLVTDDNGNFRSSFGNDIILEPRSKMALLNLTFKTAFENITIDSSNDAIQFQSDLDDAATIVEGTIPPGIYTQANIQSFYDNVELGLNRCLSLNFTTGSGADNELNSTFSMFKLNFVDGLLRIDYRYASFVNPLIQVLKFGPSFAFYTPAGGAEGITSTVTDPTTGAIDIKAASTANTANRTRNTFAQTDRKLNLGSGLYVARCKNITDNGTGLEDNGFAIGLSLKPIPNGELISGIDDEYRAFEIRVNRNTENYKFIAPGVVGEQDSGVTASKLDLAGTADVNEHPLLAFEVSEGIVQFCIYTDTARYNFKDVALEGGQELYPYIYINGGSNNCVVDCCNVSLDPYFTKNDNWYETGANDNTGHGNSYSALLESASAVRDIIPQLDDNKWSLGVEYEAKCTLHNEVWNALGFTRNGKGDGATSEVVKIGDAYFGENWSWWLPQQTPLVKDSDNFMVISDTLPLDSYDASQVQYGNDANQNATNLAVDMSGRRKNILMTIPVNDNNNGLVEFQTNQPIFIDINNPDKLNVKNLNFRLLRSDFSPILSSDEERSVMTLLLDN